MYKIITFEGNIQSILASQHYLLSFKWLEKHLTLDLSFCLPGRMKRFSFIQSFKFGSRFELGFLIRIRLLFRKWLHIFFSSFLFLLLQKFISSCLFELSTLNFLRFLNRFFFIRNALFHKNFVFRWNLWYFLDFIFLFKIFILDIMAVLLQLFFNLFHFALFFFFLLNFLFFLYFCFLLFRLFLLIYLIP